MPKIIQAITASGRKDVEMLILLPLGIKQVDNDIWLVSFMNYDLGYIDLEHKTLQPPRQPVRPEVVTHVIGTFRCLSLRSGQLKSLVGAQGLEPSTR
jgi:hypothetical protein